MALFDEMLIFFVFALLRHQLKMDSQYISVLDFLNFSICTKFATHLNQTTDLYCILQPNLRLSFRAHGLFTRVKMSMIYIYIYIANNLHCRQCWLCAKYKKVYSILRDTYYSHYYCQIISCVDFMHLSISITPNSVYKVCSCISNDSSWI